ncbi:MAG TPA: GTPase ObgE [Bacteroidales bacterium]|jgi:GTP-binding protein|nr:GTPase ObgE [Bacteroidales bacterium]HNR41949.1 GTPase ObgE [Bacteroidales bacterium]HQG77062.1 GTPase ObgE [Bacteroidales bacterium]
MSGSNFIDYLKIHCRAGNGGAGSAHLRREKFVPRGGPDGGDGGRGGNIILRGNDQMWTLLHLRYRRHIFAGNGLGGGAQQSTGADGSDVVVEVPLGTIARKGDNGEFIFEITRHGDEKILAKGGRGGLGNTHFKSATNQTPRYAQPGESGEEGTFILELKVLADVGLVGFPNAGKSTLLSVVSAAKPKIADYPFTTLVPNLGIVSYRDDKSFVMADIPGIIEGAHEGRGLGIRFLRHVERNSILVIIIAADSPDIKNEYEVVLNELKMYNPELLDKKRILAVSKSDLLDAELKDEIVKDLPEIPGVFFSSVTGEGINTLKDIIWKTLTSY